MTPLSHLNNGAGVSLSTDLQVTLADGTMLDIPFTNAKIVGDLIRQVTNAKDSNGKANNGRLTLGFNAAGNGLALYDSTTGNGSLTVQTAPPASASRAPSPVSAWTPRSRN